jgi:chitinase
LRIIFILLLLFIGCGSGSKTSKISNSFFAPYVDMSAWPLFDFNKTTFIKNYFLAFVNSDGKCEPVWGRYKEYNLSAFKKRVDFVKKLGGRVFISFGGNVEKNYTLAYVCDDLERAYEKVITYYKIYNIDLDIEGDYLEDYELVYKTLKAVKNLQLKYNLTLTLTLPVMPYGFEEDAKRVIDLADEIGVNIRAVNLMLMDYSKDYPADNPNETLMFDYSKSAIENVNKYLKKVWSGIYPLKKGEFFYKIGGIAMIGQNDVKNEYWYKSDFKKLVEYTKNKGLYLCSFWSLNRDKPLCDGCNVSNSTMLPISLYGKGEFEFAKIGKEIE